jgi:hypothetical protein
VDGQRRLDHRQQHHGQHLLSRAFVKPPTPRRSLPPGAREVSIDLDREAHASQVAAAVRRANEVIWEARDVSVRTVTRAQAQAQGVEVPEQAGDEVRLVEAQGFDLQPCGGTHPRRTSEVGLVLALGHERYKGGSRVRFACGHRALALAESHHAALREAGGLLSAPPDAVPGLLARTLEQLAEAGRRVKALQEQIGGGAAALIDEARWRRRARRRCSPACSTADAAGAPGRRPPHRRGALRGAAGRARRHRAAQFARPRRCPTTWAPRCRRRWASWADAGGRGRLAQGGWRAGGARRRAGAGRDAAAHRMSTAARVERASARAAKPTCRSRPPSSASRSGPSWCAWRSAGAGRGVHRVGPATLPLRLRAARARRTLGALNGAQRLALLGSGVALGVHFATWIASLSYTGGRVGPARQHRTIVHAGLARPAERPSPAVLGRWAQPWRRSRSRSAMGRRIARGDASPSPAPPRCRCTTWPARRASAAVARVHAGLWHRGRHHRRLRAGGARAAGRLFAARC